MKKKQIRIRAYIPVVLASMLFLFLYMYENIHIIRLGYFLQQENEALYSLKRANDQLQLRLSERISLQRLDQIARERLGLRFPAKDEVILVERVGKRCYAVVK